VDVIIIGAGIGGLTAALALERAGIKAHVYESVEDLRPLGVGINLLPHATKVLGECGLLDALAETAVATRELIYLNKLGQEIWREPRGLAAGYAWPQLSIHRGDLQMILLRAARERLGEGRIRIGHHLAEVEQMPNGQIRARFVARGTGEEIAVAGADLLIAADGIHSTVRGKLYPHEGPPKWNGVLLWRATTQGAPILTGREMITLGYPGQRFIAYPISRQEAERGHSLINWIAEIQRDPASPFRREDWNRRGQLEEFLPRFERWVFDWLDVPAIMRAADAIYEYPCVDRDPLQRWTFGRVTLLGDAAHPMYPMGSNGASQAILDARALAQALVSQPDIDRGLAAYEAARRPATAEIVLANRRQGPSEIQTIVEQRAPNGFDNIESVLSAGERAAIAERYKRMAGFDQASVNALVP
jgi:2-polyprenyl-6-methoxyphenol hydroxylase-like FAD-dependent oxidoreductase